jgi:polyhydroxybutyrate depolymerase
MLVTLASVRRIMLFSILTAACSSGSVGSSNGAGAGASASPPGTGGAAVSGGTGAAAGTGGTGAAAGAGSGGAGTAGATGTGGTAGETGGTPGAGGTPSDSGRPPSPSDAGPIAVDAGTTAGCGAATWPTGGTANPQTLNVTNNGTTTERQFYFAVPATYTSSRPYRVVFAWHYAGGTAVMVAGTGGGPGRYYGLLPILTDTISMTGQGLNDALGRTGWPNTNGQDVAFARAMLDWVNANFCVDRSRIMSTGFSYGAIMSHTVACQMPDVFRAVGVMSGSLIGRGACLARPIAAWMTHGADDNAAIGGVEFTAGVAARDRILASNHCGTTSQPVDPAPCVAYDGCDAGYPVVWCPREAPRTDTGHVIPTFAPAAIATFFSQF